jgi:hypothetical protein
MTASLFHTDTASDHTYYLLLKVGPMHLCSTVTLGGHPSQNHFSLGCLTLESRLGYSLSTFTRLHSCPVILRVEQLNLVQLGCQATTPTLSEPTSRTLPARRSKRKIHQTITNTSMLNLNCSQPKSHLHPT